MDITQAEIDNAIKLWRVSVEKEYRGLLQARTVKRNSDSQKYLVAGLIVFFASRYFNPLTGAFISFLVVRNALEKTIDTIGVSMNQTTRKLRDGDITIDQWEQEMRRDIMALMIVATLAARGGLEQMTPADWVGLQGRIEAQYSYLGTFKNDILNGLVSDGRLLSRADLYSDAGISAFEEVRTLMREADGWEEEIRILEPGVVHCQGCKDQAELGWQPIGTLDPIGAEECGVRCKCTKKYRREENGRTITTEEE